MPINDANRICIYARQCFYINPKSTKHILDLGTSVIECPGDALDLNPVQEV